MNIVEQYNLTLKTTEDGTVRLLNRVLDQAFNRLVRRTRVHIRLGKTDQPTRNLALLQEFRQLIPAVRPDQVDPYDKLFRNLLGDASKAGLQVAENLSNQMAPARSRIDVSIPLDATASAASQARGYLQKHGETFATTSAEVVAQGIAEGRPTDRIVSDLRTRLGIVKGRADAIVRTETLRAYNNASDLYYANNGIEHVMYYTTADDRACPVCTPRAGKIYKRTDINVPLHPRCRCYLAPWDLNISNIDPDYEAQRKAHQEDVSKVAPPEPVNLNKAAVFERTAPTPVST